MDTEIMTVKELAGLIDHTNLKADARKADIERLCAEAAEHGFRAVAINSAMAALAARLLEGTQVHVGATVSFPLGQMPIEAKVFEMRKAIEDGAREIDYVLNISELRDANYAYIEREMEAIVAVCRENAVISKVIFENCYLTKEEITMAARTALKVRPDFIKTSTGFGTGGATVEDVRLMKSVVGDAVKVKAAGGIRDYASCRAMIEAGAERIGTSSGIKIITEFLNRQRGIL